MHLARNWSYAKPINILLLQFPFAIFTAQAALFQHGDWYLDQGVGYREAYSTNASGSAIAIFCGENRCFLLQVQPPCTDATERIALVNADTGAFLIPMFCTALSKNGNTEFVDVLGNFDNLKSTLESNPNVGFSIPVQSGQFRIIRFALVGSTEVIEAVIDPEADPDRLQ